MSFPAYPSYEDSGVAWLGKVPSDWSIERLRIRANLITTKAEAKTRPIALENIESWSGKLIKSNTEFQNDGVAFEAGDILFGKLRPYLAKVHAAEFSGQAVGDFHVIRPAISADSKFLAYCLLTRELISLIDGSTYGAKMPRASWNFIREVRFVFPSLAEQVSIVAFLDRETAKIDALIDEQRRLIALLKEKRQAIISHAVTKGLNSHAPMKDSGIEWLGEVPAHWKVVSAKRVADVFVPQRNKPDLNESSDGLPWVTMEDMEKTDIADTRMHVSQEAAKIAGCRSLPMNSVVASCVGNFGSSAINRRPVYINQQIQGFITKNFITPEFLRIVVEASTAYFEKVATAATLPYVNQQGFANLPVPLPPLTEQQEIVAHQVDSGAKIDILLATVAEAVLLLNERRAALISAAVTGKIDARDSVSAEKREAA